MPTDPPLVSIIIPAYNQDVYLRQSIDSALAQTYQPVEIIVVDDGSTDDTADIAQNYGEQIRYIYQENLGLAGARNSGIRAAHGELIGLLDADDIWEPTYLETIVSLAQLYPEASVFHSCAQCMDTKGNPLPQIVGRRTAKEPNLLKSLLQSNFLIPSTITLRRDTVVAADYFDQTLRSCEDWDLWLRILPEAKFVGTDAILVRYRVHEQSLSANVSGMHTAKQAVIEKIFGLDDGSYDEWTPEKRFAYSGLYRYFLITSIQRGGNWEAGIENLFRSLLIDPIRAKDTDLFYELALGIQPVGYRGSNVKIDIATNADQVIRLVDHVFQHENAAQIEPLKRTVYGTACYAIGLAAYHTGNIRFSRGYLWSAGIKRPELWTTTNLVSNLSKALLGDQLLRFLRQIKSKT